jgi:hypothetical protein
MVQEKTLPDNKGIKIDKEGNWFYYSRPIINKNVYLFFNQHIEKDEEDGYVLRIENETCKIQVEDTPYVVIRVDFVIFGPEKEESIKIRLNDETEETLDISSFYIGKDNVPYCRVKKGKFPARFLRQPYYQIAQHIQPEGPDRFYLFLNNKKNYINFFMQK